MAGRARWSDLPDDILVPILRRLVIVDYVRSAAVCSFWRSAARAATQSPCLLFRGPPHSDPSTANLLPLSREGHPNTLCTLPFPVADLREHWIIGSSHGWLITVDPECDVHMLNPITCAKITLPPITTFPDVEAAVRDSSGALTGFVFSHGNYQPAIYHPKIMQKNYFTKIIAAPGPAGIGGGNYTALAIAHCDPTRLAFARGGDDKWTSLQSVYDAGFYDIIHYKGLFYGVSVPPKIVAFDLSGAVPQAKELSMDIGERPEFDRFYVVESLGDLLMVRRLVTVGEDFWEEEELNPITYAFRVFKLEGKHGNWVEVKSLGNRALFLGWGESVSLSVLDFPEVRENCIYFTDDGLEVFFARPEADRDVGVYSLEDGNISRELFHPYIAGLNMLPSVWFTPHL